MNKEAQDYIDSLVDRWNDGESVEETLRKAMRWAYADAINVVKTAGCGMDSYGDDCTEGVVLSLEDRCK